jgi:predicted dehydrogenase
MTESTPIKVGILGCGNICPAYFNGAKKLRSIELVGCADMLLERAQARATEFGCQAFSVDEMLAHPEIQIIVNLTIPKAHGEVALRALNAGKSVYNEKPLALTRAEGDAMLSLAAQKGLLVGGAPDTFLGAGLQTCRKLIDDGAIGEPIGFNAFMLCHGHESWHPDPDFYYQPGGGPMFDMGPYYLAALVNLLGPVRRVTGSVRTTFAERKITSQPKNGTIITVRVPTHIVSVLDFASGAAGTLTTSFDIWQHSMPNIEIYGTHGSLSVPDPNSFGGPVRIARDGARAWTDVDLTHSYPLNARGIGVADMAQALQRGDGRFRANGALCHHVLDIMHAIHDASNSNTHVLLASTCERPDAMPVLLAEGEI